VNPLREIFSRLPAEHQRRWVLGAVFLVLLGVISLIASLLPEPRKLESRKVVVKNLLTDADPRALGIDGLASELRAIRKGQDDLTSRLKSLEEHRAQPSDTEGPLPASETETAIRNEMAALRSELDALRKPPIANDKPLPMGPSPDVFPPLPTPKPSSRGPPMTSMPSSPASISGISPRPPARARRAPFGSFAMQMQKRPPPRE